MSRTVRFQDGKSHRSILKSLYLILFFLSRSTYDRTNQHPLRRSSGKPVAGLSCDTNRKRLLACKQCRPVWSELDDISSLKEELKEGVAFNLTFKASMCPCSSLCRTETHRNTVCFGQKHTVFLSERLTANDLFPGSVSAHRNRNSGMLISLFWKQSVPLGQL